MDLKELKEKIASAGIIGAGGAGFPTAVKLSEDADTLLINASECEPLLYTDFYLLKNALPTVLEGARIVMEATGIPRAVLGIKAHNGEKLGWTQGQMLAPKVSVHLLPNTYPFGDEIILTYQVLHRIIQPGKLPISEGVTVMNAETLYNVCRAVRDDAPVVKKWITVNGKVKNPTVLQVPVGTPVRELFAALGEKVSEDCVVVDGGPAMGNIVDAQTAVIKKTTKGITVLPRESFAVMAKLTTNRVVKLHAGSNCCQCTLCTDMCPRALIGYPLTPHKAVRTNLQDVEENPQRYAEAMLCCGCGVCELVACCQNISPRRMYAQIRGILAKNQVRYTGPEVYEANPQRDYRMVQTERFKRLTGLSAIDQMPEFSSMELHPHTVELPLKMHAGAPATAIVKEGDAVTAGQLLAEANGAISARIHSPISGTVTAVSASQITVVPAV